MLRGRIEADATCAQLGLQGRRYGVVTLHRPSNVDERDTLQDIVRQLRAAAASVDLVFPVHPRTRKQLQAFALHEALLLIREEEIRHRDETGGRRNWRRKVSRWSSRPTHPSDYAGMTARRSSARSIPSKSSPCRTHVSLLSPRTPTPPIRPRWLPRRGPAAMDRWAPGRCA